MARAYAARSPVSTDGAADIWALGVIVYEAISGSHAFPRLSGTEPILKCAHGGAKYPWEGDGVAGGAFARSRVRELVLRCLSREPDRRPRAPAVLRAIDRISNATTLDVDSQGMMRTTFTPEVAALLKDAT